MQYFQYDNLRSIAGFVVKSDLKNSDPISIREATKLDFSAPVSHSPWRNYARIFKLCLLVSEQNSKAMPTDVARILSRSGIVTCDEYLHFLIEATTDPSPALSDWAKIDSRVPIRAPLCFSLKYLLAKVAGLGEYITSINEIIGAYMHSEFIGDENDTEFLGLMHERNTYIHLIKGIDLRQARESIKFMSQISYLHNVGNNIVVSLSKEDAHDIFDSIHPISGPREPDGNAEIQRLARFFRDGSEHDFFEYRGTMLSDEIESGFHEGSKVKKTHVIIERNAKLRVLYFEKFPVTACNSCNINTSRKYPWVDRVLDLHHILPLSSGTRVDSRIGTMLEDLVPVCPTCHRAIHKFYDDYLKVENKKDFANQNEARFVYRLAKQKIVENDCYA